MLRPSAARTVLSKATLSPSQRLALRQAPSSNSRFNSSSSSSSSSSTSSSKTRSYIKITAAAAAITTAYIVLPFPSVFADDRAPADVPGDTRPSPLWALPSRAQMIQALRDSSAKSIRPNPNRADEDDRSINSKASETQSSSPSPAAHQSSTQEARDAELLKTNDKDGFDLLIIGGGATGTGVAVDAATRGLSVALVERDDFGAGTSSKSTKLIHGGVRYLQKAVFNLDYDQYKMVREALHERKTFLHIAPYLSEHLPIMLPVYRYWQIPYYLAGTKMYDFIAGGENMEASYLLGRGRAMEAFPMLKSEGLAGAVVYYDGQHNDTRMNIALALTAVHHGAVMANHTEVTALHKKTVEGKKEPQVCGARMRDLLTGEEWDVKCKGVINATGPFADSIRKLDTPTAQEIVAPSSGVHITLPGYYSPRGMGLIDPQTSDGRVIFFLPWQGNTIAGTTDTAAPVEAHPLPKEEEIQWILDEVRNYLSPDIKVRRGDVLSAWSGLRPLVRDPDAKDTQSLVRNHMINVSDSGLLTIAGGKWTTYREMAEQTVDRAIDEYSLKPVRGCVTKSTRLLGSHGWSKTMYVKLLQRFGLETDVAKHLAATYGDRAWSVCSIAEATGLRWPVHGVRLDPLYPYIEAEVRYACRSEYAATVQDFIARRSRLSFLNVEATVQTLPRIIELMSEELGWDKVRQESELKETVKFLGSMGLTPSRQSELLTYDLAQLTADVARRAHSLGQLSSSSLDSTDQLATQRNLSARAQFSHDELQDLQRKFEKLDVDPTGRFDSRHLADVLTSLGYREVDASTLDTILTEVDDSKVNPSSSSKSRPLAFETFLDVVSALKDVRLNNPFSTSSFASGSSSQTSPSSSTGNDGSGSGADPIGPSASEKSQRREQRRTIPAERSGGGW